MIYLPTDTLAHWNGVLNGHKVYDYEASKHCPPETKVLVGNIMALGKGETQFQDHKDDYPTFDYEPKDPNSPNVMSLDGEEFFVWRKGGGEVVSLGRPEPIPKSVRDLCAQVHLDIANAESQISQPNPDYEPPASEAPLVRSPCGNKFVTYRSASGKEVVLEHKVE